MKTRFAIEAVNNNLPLVLMTPHPDPRTEDFEGYLRYATTPDPCPFLEAVELHEHKADLNSVHYAQYCGLSRKKAGDALMASHPDDLYSSRLKLAEFVEEELVACSNRIWHPTDSYWRLWFWKGVLVVAGDLLVVSEAHDGSLSLAEVDEGRLIFNFHSSDQPRSALIQVVRESRLLAYLNESVAEDREIALKLRAARRSGTPGATEHGVT